MLKYMIVTVTSRVCCFISCRPVTNSLKKIEWKTFFLRLEATDLQLLKHQILPPMELIQSIFLSCLSFRIIR